MRTWPELALPLAAEKDGHLDDRPTNHSPKFLSPLQTGTEALTAGTSA